MRLSLGEPKPLRQVSSKPFLFSLTTHMDATRREHLRRLIRDAFEDDRSRFCLRAKLTKGRVSQLLDPTETFGERAAKNLVSTLNLSTGYFERPLSPETEGPLKRSSAQSPGVQSITQPEVKTPRIRGDIAHLTIQPAATVGPSHQWGDILPTALPDVFSVALPDDAMAPDLPRGSVITFSASSAALSGQGVLLIDKDGTLYFREYRSRTATAWQAVARNPAFLPLDSSDDGLSVVGVMTARHVEGSML